MNFEPLSFETLAPLKGKKVLVRTTDGVIMEGTLRMNSTPFFLHLATGPEGMIVKTIDQAQVTGISAAP